MFFPDYEGIEGHNKMDQLSFFFGFFPIMRELKAYNFILIELPGIMFFPDYEGIEVGFWYRFSAWEHSVFSRLWGNWSDIDEKTKYIEDISFFPIMRELKFEVIPNLVTEDKSFFPIMRELKLFSLNWSLESSSRFFPDYEGIEVIFLTL